MAICSILVSVDIDGTKSSALDYAIDLAAKFDAELIGLAAEAPNLTFVGIDGGAAAVDLFALERQEIERRLSAAGEDFERKVPKATPHRWLSYLDSPTRAIIDNAASADLIVTGAKTSSAFGGQQVVDLGEIVLGAGRPVLDVQTGAGPSNLDTILIAWKNTREARRAVADALPLLKLAKTVAAITVSEGDEPFEQARLGDLAAWLARHGVIASTELIKNPEGFTDVIETRALTMRAGLVVAGGYGHARMREWLFGGVTRDLLGANSLNRFLSN